MASDSRLKIVSSVIVIFGFMIVFFLSGYIERIRPALPTGHEDEDLALHGSKLKGYALGFEGLIADWYWMKSLQYVGDKLLASKEEFINLDDLRPLNPRLLYPYLENATDLDPRFMAAYSYGALVLPAIDPEKAIRLTEKGIADNPDQWRLYQYLGYIYWRLGQYDKASEIYEKGAKLDGVPPFMTMMAASMKKQGGDRETARSIYRQMYDEAGDSETKYYAEIRLMELKSLDERDAIRSALQKFKSGSGRCANSWSEILPLLAAVKLPDNNDFIIDKSNNLIDPSGAPYLLDKESCDVKLDSVKTKIPLK